MYGVPPEQEQSAQQLADDILNGLRSAQTAIDSKYDIPGKACGCSMC